MKVLFSSVHHLQTIGKCSFKECSLLVNITIPNNDTEICYGAFLRCSSLINITIPKSIKIGFYKWLQNKYYLTIKTFNKKW